MKPMIIQTFKKGTLSSPSPTQIDVESGLGKEARPRRPLRRRVKLVTRPDPRFHMLILVAPLILAPLLIGVLCATLIINDTLTATGYEAALKGKTRVDVILEIQNISNDIRNLMSSEDMVNAIKPDGNESVNDILIHWLDLLQRIDGEVKTYADRQEKKFREERETEQNVKAVEMNQLAGASVEPSRAISEDTPEDVNNEIISFT